MLLKAPRHPFHVQEGMVAPAGFHSDDHGDWCAECAPVSVYYFGRKMPKGWRVLPKRPRAKNVPKCQRCEEEIR